MVWREILSIKRTKFPSKLGAGCPPGYANAGALSEPAFRRSKLSCSLNIACGKQKFSYLMDPPLASHLQCRSPSFRCHGGHPNRSYCTCIAVFLDTVMSISRNIFRYGFFKQALDENTPYSRQKKENTLKLTKHTYW